MDGRMGWRRRFVCPAPSLVWFLELLCSSAASEFTRLWGIGLSEWSVHASSENICRCWQIFFFWFNHTRIQPI